METGEYAWKARSGDHKKLLQTMQWPQLPLIGAGKCEKL